VTWLEDVHFTDDKHGIAVGSQGTILRTEDGGATWQFVNANLTRKEWLYAVTFFDAQRGYAVGARGIILRTDDGGATWNDQESGIETNLFAVGVAGRDDALVSGEQGRVLRTRNGGVSWEPQPTHTSVSLFGLAYRGGSDTWVAGRGGAILKRMDGVATVSIPRPRIPPAMRNKPKLQPQSAMETPIVLDDDDIPRAVPNDKRTPKPDKER
jgi:photosystem II stability/assembly factor-like uncharacterized protein